MPSFTIPLAESNDCHNPAGAGGGQFCSASDSAKGGSDAGGASVSRAEEQEYLFGRCGVFAVALHQRTGWPIVNLTRASGQLVHSAVQMPDGRLVDYAGVVTPGELARRYKVRGRLRQKPVPRGGAVTGFNAEGHKTVEEALDRARAVIAGWKWRTLFTTPLTETKLAAECSLCPDCGEPWCDECGMHYAECSHLGPHSEP
jgi:hypothetical protein